MENTRKIFITMHTGYAGMDSHEAWLVPTSLTDDELYTLADDRALDHAEAYGIYRPNDDDEEEQDQDYCGDNIEGSWKDFDEKKHTGLVTYGNGDGISWNEY